MIVTPFMVTIGMVQIFAEWEIPENLNKPMEYNYPSDWYPRDKISSSQPRFSSSEKHQPRNGCVRCADPFYQIICAFS